MDCARWCVWLFFPESRCCCNLLASSHLNMFSYPLVALALSKDKPALILSRALLLLKSALRVCKTTATTIPGLVFYVLCARDIFCMRSSSQCSQYFFHKARAIVCNSIFCNRFKEPSRIDCMAVSRLSSFPIFSSDKSGHSESQSTCSGNSKFMFMARWM